MRSLVLWRSCPFLCTVAGRSRKEKKKKPEALKLLSTSVAFYVAPPCFLVLSVCVCVIFAEERKIGSYKDNRLYFPQLLFKMNGLLAVLR